MILTLLVRSVVYADKGIGIKDIRIYPDMSLSS